MQVVVPGISEPVILSLASSFPAVQTSGVGDAVGVQPGFAAPGLDEPW